MANYKKAIADRDEIRRNLDIGKQEFARLPRSKRLLKSVGDFFTLSDLEGQELQWMVAEKRARELEDKLKLLSGIPEEEVADDLDHAEE